MATHKSTRRKAKSSHSARRLHIDPQSLSDFFVAFDEVRTAGTLLRYAHTGLHRDENCLEADVKMFELHTLISRGRSAAELAANSLFQIGRGDPVADEAAEPILRGLFDVIDVITLAGYATKFEELPASGAVTANPVRGALNLAIARLESLEQQIATFVGSVRTKVIPGYAHAKSEAA